MKLLNTLLLSAVCVPWMANAQLVVTTDLGDLGSGTMNLVGDTATGANNADYFNGWNGNLAWGNEHVYSFETSNDNFAEITLNNQSGDIDFAVVDSLDVDDDGGGGRIATGTVGFAFLDAGVPEPIINGPAGSEPVLLPAGVYYLVATAFGAGANSTFDFDFTLSNASPPADVLDLGLFDTLSGEFLVFDASSSTFAPAMALFDATGALIQGGDGPDIELGTGLESGVYYLALTPEGAEFLPGWDVEASLSPAGDWTLNYDDDGVENGTLDVGEVQFFRFEIGQGLPVGIDLGTIAVADAPIVIDSNGSTFDTELGVYDSAGVLVLQNDDFAWPSDPWSILDLPDGLEEGVYFVALGEFNTVFNPDFDGVSTGANGGNWVLNHPAGSTNGLLGPTEIQWFTFTIGEPAEQPEDFIDLGVLASFANESLTIGADNSDFPPTLGVFSTGGTLLASADEVINRPAGFPVGDYFLALGEESMEFMNGFEADGGAGTGNWELTYPGGMRNGTLAAVGDVQWFRFTLEAAPVQAPDSIPLGQIVGENSPFMVDSNGSGFDTELGLYDSNGGLIQNDDDGGDGLQSLLDVVAGLTDGTYYVALGQFNTIFGPAEFNVTTSGASGGDWILNYPTGSMNGTLGGGEIQWFSFTVGNVPVAPPLIVSFGIDLVSFDSASIEWESVDGASYTIQGTPDAETWTDLATDIPSEGETTEGTVNGIAAGGYRLFRVVRQ